MSIFTNTAITVYNAWRDPETNREVYRPTILRDVKWQGSRAASLDNQGVAAASSLSLLTTIIIWASRLRDTQGRQYLEPRAYAALDAENVDGYFTLCDEKDRIVKGAVDSPAVTGVIGDVLKVNDTVIIMISAVTDNRFGPAYMRHWYVSGLGA